MKVVVYSLKMENELPEELKLEFEREDSMGTSRVLRKGTHQPKTVCPKEERNASLKKVNMADTFVNIDVFFYEKSSIS